MTTESSPPLYFLSAKLMLELYPLEDITWTKHVQRQTEEELLNIRFVSLLGCIITPFCILLLVVFSRFWLVGLVGATYLAINPFGIWYGVEARPYALWLPLLTIHVLTSLYVIAELTKNDETNSSWSAWITYLILSWLCFATHYFSVFPIAVSSFIVLCIIVGSGNNVGSNLKRWLITHGALGISLLPLGYLAYLQASQGHTEYIPPPSVKEFLLSVFVVYPLGLDATLPAWFKAPVAFGVLGILSGGFIVPAYKLIIKKEKLGRFEWVVAYCFGLALLPNILLFLFSLLVRPVYIYDRYTICALPAFALLIGMLTQHALLRITAASPPKIFKVGYLIILLSVATVFVGAGVQYYRYVEPSRQSLRYPWKDFMVNMLDQRTGISHSWPTDDTRYHLVPDPLQRLPLQFHEPHIPYLESPPPPGTEYSEGVQFASWSGTLILPSVITTPHDFIDPSLYEGEKPELQKVYSDDHITIWRTTEALEKERQAIDNHDTRWRS
jgi:uncharacterized membrane protein